MTATTESPAAPPAREPGSWTTCPGCSTMLYSRRLERNQHVCPECGAHHRLTATQRVAHLLDPGFTVLDTAAALPADPDVLGFTDRAPYPRRLASARAATGLDEAVLVATGTVEGAPVVTAVMDFRFLGGSLGAAVGELVTAAAELAVARRTPLLLVTASGGARMQEGALSLMQMAKTAQALAELDAAGVLSLTLVTDPTYGGVAASFATLTDIVLAEPGARMGFAGPRVIAETIRDALPEGFQTAEFLLAHGLVDQVVRRSALRGVLGRLLSCVAEPRPGAPGDGGIMRDPALLGPVDPWAAVRGARHLDRPTTLDYLRLAFDGFEELHGDRMGQDCPAVVGGMARLDGVPVVVIGHQKGHTAVELGARNFGMGMPAGYRKAARLMRVADKLGLPVVTIVDTPGAYPGTEAEERGQAVAIAECIRLMATLRVPVLALVSGEGGSGGALALAVADEVLVCAGGVYSVISPEGCAAILWHDRAAAPEAARALGVDAVSLLRHGVVDGVVPEPPGGAHTDPAAAAALVGSALAAALRALLARDPDERRATRRARFRAFGAPAPLVPPAPMPQSTERTRSR
ncbi:acetyl-CoA carboxylase carboxyl transferase subunit alpha [Actinokineospora sp. G85]|uniref:acetyl-CoA carboxylase carboxyl transferase subunit alpha n=1 Tax=Actinokineospora sp. G85 TaxID=3406626 RepID=UPI003C757D70